MDKALCLLPLLATWEYCWPNAPIPQKAILAGHDSDGSPLYVGRAIHNDGQLPGKVKFYLKKHMVFLGCDNLEYTKPAFDVLVNGNVSWVRSEFGEVPRNAILGGRTSYGEPLYIGRAYYKGSLTPGKIVQSNRALFIPYGRKEISFKYYEVLVQN